MKETRRCTKAGNDRISGSCCRSLLYLVLFVSTLIPFSSLVAQEEPDFEEISVVLFVRQVGSTEIPAFIKGEDLFLPLTDVFSFLKIMSTPTMGYDTVSGFFLNQQSRFLVDRVNNRITFMDKVFDLKQGDLIRTENNLYLRSTYFGQVFGLDCNFSFSSLSVNLTTKLELPVIREMRQSMMRSNLEKLRGDVRPDTVIRRNYPFFHFGAADWAVSATERVLGNTTVRANLALGGILAGGELLLNLNYSNMQPFRAQQQNYRWHFANNELKLVKQVIAGKIQAQPISSINAPIIGLQVTNTPTTFQRSFCTYTLSDYTEPGWIVELYVNYVLVDYVKADASGYFSFEVPLVYGNSLVKLRFYGPWGEEHTREQTIRIPFNFLRPGKFEYTASLGFVENEHTSKFSKLNMSYGISRRLTVGGGVEYLSENTNRPFIPFANFSIRLANSLLVSGEYAPGVRFRGVVSYRMASDLLFEVYYTNLDKNQEAINTNYLEERKLVVSKPIRLGRFSSLMRMTLNQVILPGSEYFSSELLVSGAFFGVSTNLTMYALMLDWKNPYIFSILSLGFKLPGRILVTPQAQYVHSENRLLSGKLELEKRVFRNGTITCLFEKNFVNNINSVQLGVRYDFNAMQASVSSRYANDYSAFLQYARGSIIYEGKGQNVRFSRISSVGKGGIVIRSFLDLNGNMKYEQGEPKVVGVDVRVTGGRIEKNYRDSTVLVTDLEPFTAYFLEFDRRGFEFVSWQISRPIVNITVNPNQIKLLDVPVSIMGEVTGTVAFRNDTIQKGLGRIILNLFREDSTLVSTILTEEDGYFSYLGLVPGQYFISTDPNQMARTRLQGVNRTYPFEIRPMRDGDRAEGIEIYLYSDSN